MSAIVEVLAYTVPHANTMRRLAGLATAFSMRSDSGSGIDGLAEFAGRLCYKSWNLPNPATANNSGYLANIIEQQHYSVLEHGSVTFYLEGVSRSFLAEITRHRHLSFSVVSQRYVDADTLGVVEPPIFADLEPDDLERARELWRYAVQVSLQSYDELVDLLDDSFPEAKRKQVREAARSLLVNATDSPMVVTGNLRAWRDVLGRRLSPAADAEIRAVAEQILDKLRDIAPGAVQDLRKASEVD